LRLVELAEEPVIELPARKSWTFGAAILIHSVKLAPAVSGFATVKLPVLVIEHPQAVICLGHPAANAALDSTKLRANARPARKLDKLATRPQESSFDCATDELPSPNANLPRLDLKRRVKSGPRQAANRAGTSRARLNLAQCRTIRNAGCSQGGAVRNAGLCVAGGLEQGQYPERD
jgi:hypothetical protein